MTSRSLSARLAVTTAALAATSLAVAAPAPVAPVVAAQIVQKGGTFPADIPGQSPAAHAGGRLRTGQRLISRLVTLAGGQQVRIALTCPKGRVQRGLGVGPASTVAFTVVNAGHYIGVRRVVVRATGRTRAGRMASGHVYGLCS
jgi:hypothetical protein